MADAYRVESGKSRFNHRAKRSADAEERVQCIIRHVKKMLPQENCGREKTKVGRARGRILFSS